MSFKDRIKVFLGLAFVAKPEFKGKAVKGSFAKIPIYYLKFNLRFLLTGNLPE